MILVGMFILWRINKLKKLEVVAIWLFIPILLHDVVVGLSNLRIIEITKNIEMYSSFILSKTLLFPILIMLFINASIGRSFVPIRIIISLLFVAFLLLVEYSFEWAGIITHKNGMLWSSFVFWLLTVYFLLGFRQLFNTLMQRGYKRIV
jgi:hypothetical protein